MQAHHPEVQYWGMRGRRYESSTVSPFQLFLGLFIEYFISILASRSTRTVWSTCVLLTSFVQVKGECGKSPPTVSVV